MQKEKFHVLRHHTVFRTRVLITWSALVEQHFVHELTALGREWPVVTGLNRQRANVDEVGGASNDKGTGDAGTE